MDDGMRADLALARDRAVDFLLARRSRRGWWRDFETLAGPSDEWVTGYVGSVLARAPDERARAAARTAWKRLRIRRPWAAGWGFSGRTPSDADSTIWGARLAEEVGAAGSWRARRATRELERYMDAAGGVCTYAEDGPIRHFTRVAPNASFAGWCSPHVCVTAAAAGLRNLPRRAEALRWLESERQPDGRWRAYWWAGDEYVTALAVTALGNPELAGQAATWAAGRLGSLDAPFALACALEVLLAAGAAQHRDAADLALATLLSAQRSDGSWEPSALMRIPPPDHVDPESYDGYSREKRASGGLILDDFACYTTAAVLSALLAAS